MRVENGAEGTTVYEELEVRRHNSAVVLNSLQCLAGFCIFQSRSAVASLISVSSQRNEVALSELIAVSAEAFPFKIEAKGKELRLPHRS